MARSNAWMAPLFLAVLLVTAPRIASAQDADNDASPPVEQDAKDLLGERAQPPDLSNDAPPPGVRQGDSAGTANFSIPVQNQTETVTTTREHGSSVSVGVNEGAYVPPVPVAGEIVNHPPPPPGWPGYKHANRPRVVAGGPVARVNAGPIWNNDDAQGKCPNVCASVNMGWTSGWRTTSVNQSECDCAAYADAPPPDAPDVGPGTYCEAPPNYQCGGCSVHCPAGKIAHCTQGDRGIFNKPDSRVCGKDAVCACN